MVGTLGVSMVSVCGPQGVEWWAMGPDGTTISKPIKWSDVGNVFRDHRDELAPSRIYDAKLRRSSGQASQPWFFDLGLMPAIERNRGQTLLRLVENAIAALHTHLAGRLEPRQARENAYRMDFRFLAPEGLDDKTLANFIRIGLKNCA